MDNNNTALDRNLFEQFARDNVGESFRSHQHVPSEDLEKLFVTKKPEATQPHAAPHKEESPQLHYEAAPSQHQIVPNDVFISVNTSFPFAIFPDTISVDTTKVSIIKRSFFMTSQAFSIRVEDILDVTLSLGPFFGSIKIHTRFYDREKSAYFINWLKRSDAIKIKHILHGYVIARHNGIDLSSLSKEEQLSQMVVLGHE